MDFKKPISELLDEVRKAYIDRQREQGIRASGESADTLRPDPKQTSGALYGARYFTQQKLGRRPGKFPPISDILDWIRYKGIQPTDISERSLAFIIARKIAQQGTDVHQGKREGLDVEDRVAKSVDEFRAKLVAGFRANIVQSLKDVSR